MLAPIARSVLAASLYFATATPVATFHALGRQTAYVGAGDQTAATSIPAKATNTLQSYYGQAAIEARSDESAKVVVRFGDAITDGFNSTVDAARRYPDQLDNRLKAAGLARTGMANQGVSGNRCLYDFADPNGNGRFERDVLIVAGVTHLLILLGINDIGLTSLVPSQAVSADQISCLMAAAITKAKDRRIKVYLASLLPFKGAGYSTAEGEMKRQALNVFIRNNTIDPACDSGDHLYPNDAGYGAMAAAIDLQALQ